MWRVSDGLGGAGGACFAGRSLFRLGRSRRGSSCFWFLTTTPVLVFVAPRCCRRRRRRRRRRSSSSLSSSLSRPPVRASVLPPVGACRRNLYIHRARTRKKVMFPRKERVRGGPPSAPSSLTTADKCVNTYINGILQPKVCSANDGTKRRRDPDCFPRRGRLAPSRTGFSDLLVGEELPERRTQADHEHPPPLHVVGACVRADRFRRTLAPLFHAAGCLLASVYPVSGREPKPFCGSCCCCSPT